MPRPSKTQCRSASGSDKGSSVAEATPNFAADHAGAESVSSSEGAASAFIQADQPQQHPRPFDQSRLAAHKLLQALRHDLHAISISAKACATATASSLRTKFHETKGQAESSILHTLGRWVAIVPANKGQGVRHLAKALKISRDAWKNTSVWKITVGSTVLVGIALAGTVLVWALKDVPWSEIRNGTLKPVVVLETADGEPLVRQGPYQGPYAQYDQFPPHLIDAVLSIEDRRFMDHFGIDVRGIGRALVRNFEAGLVVEGGSTITQQLIKLQYLDSDRTIKRRYRSSLSPFGWSGNSAKRKS